MMRRNRVTFSRIIEALFPKKKKTVARDNSKFPSLEMPRKPTTRSSAFIE